MKELEAKRKALAAESEVYRQTLKLELQNLRLCALRARRKFSNLSSASRWLFLAAPLAGSFLTKRRPWPRLLATLVMAWQLGRKIPPLIGGFFSRPRIKEEPRGDDRVPAANV